MRTGTALVGTGFIGPVHVEALRRLGRPVLGVLGSTPERGRAAAAALNLSPGAVYVAKSRVLARLRQEVQQMQED